MTHRGRARGRAAGILVSCLCLGALAGACASDDEGSSAGTSVPASSQTGTVCSDAEALSSSVDALKDVDLKAEGTNGVNAALEAVEDDLATLGDSATNALKPDVDAVKDAVEELMTAAGSISTQGIAPTATAVAKVATTTRALVDEVESGPC